MICPTCECKTIVLETRNYKDNSGNFTYIERKRRCTKCNEKSTSIEIFYEVWETYYKPESNS